MNPQVSAPSVPPPSGPPADEHCGPQVLPERLRDAGIGSQQSEGVLAVGPFVTVAVCAATSRRRESRDPLSYPNRVASIAPNSDTFADVA